jgi:hypothetical protein
MRISTAEARRIGNKLKVNWDRVRIDQLRAGIQVEWEHRKVVGNKLTTIAKIALTHLKEFPDYYTRLKIVESKKKLY